MYLKCSWGLEAYNYIMVMSFIDRLYTDLGRPGDTVAGDRAI